MGNEEGGPLSWEVCFELTTADSANCESTGDLSVGMMTFADGQTGSYTNTGCNPDNEVVWNNASPSCTVLPVELLSFEGEERTEGNELRWVTASEDRCSHYILQRSENGKDFERMERVEGNGSTSKRNSYEAFDPDPYRGVTYYRLEQVDLDGASELSRIIAIDREQRPLDGLRVRNAYPNPVEGKRVRLELEAGKSSDVDIKIYDRAGKEVRRIEERVEKGRSTLQMKVESLAPGFYTVRVQRSEDPSQGGSTHFVVE